MMDKFTRNPPPLARSKPRAQVARWVLAGVLLLLAVSAGGIWILYEVVALPKP